MSTELTFDSIVKVILNLLCKIEKEENYDPDVIAYKEMFLKQTDENKVKMINALSDGLKFGEFRSFLKTSLCIRGFPLTTKDKLAFRFFQFCWELVFNCPSNVSQFNELSILSDEMPYVEVFSKFPFSNPFKLNAKKLEDHDSILTAFKLNGLIITGKKPNPIVIQSVNPETTVKKEEPCTFEKLIVRAEGRRAKYGGKNATSTYVDKIKRFRPDYDVPALKILSAHIEQIEKENSLKKLSLHNKRDAILDANRASYVSPKEEEEHEMEIDEEEKQSINDDEY